MSDLNTDLERYLDNVRRFSFLTEEREYTLATDWKKVHDIRAKDELVKSHLLYAAKLALDCRGYGLPVSDLIGAANVGLARAVNDFDPNRGVRLATYARWWIQSEIKEYIIHNWSLVNIKNHDDEKLFFKKGKLKQMIESEGNDVPPATIQKIAQEFDVSESSVVRMIGRLSGHDVSLNMPLNEDATSDWLDNLPDDTQQSPEDIVIVRSERSHDSYLIDKGLQVLDERESYIIRNRRLVDEDDVLKLEDIGNKYGVSRERIRQIEVKAFEKFERAVRDAKREAFDRKVVQAHEPTGARNVKGGALMNGIGGLEIKPNAAAATAITERPKTSAVPSTPRQASVNPTGKKAAQPVVAVADAAEQQSSSSSAHLVDSNPTTGESEEWDFVPARRRLPPASDPEIMRRSAERLARILA